MKYAISTDSGRVAEHFGRCPEYTVIDIEDNIVKTKEVFQNPGHSPGRIPAFIDSKGAEVMICGGMGMRAAGFFESYGIKTVVGVNGTIEEVVEKILNGELKSGKSNCSPGGGRGYGIEKIECDHEE